MSFEIEKEVREHYILYKISGTNSFQNFIQLADGMDNDNIQLHISNFVLDCKDIDGILGIGELFEVGNYFAKKLKSCKLAGINTPSEWRNNQFSENVIHNRGGQLEHFQSIEDAERWFSKI